MSVSITAAFPHTVAPGDLAAVPRLLIPALGEVAAFAADEGSPLGEGGELELVAAGFEELAGEGDR